MLADVKAVGPGYPLRGAILLVDGNAPDGIASVGHPAARARRGRMRVSPRVSASASAIPLPSANRRSGSAPIVQQEPEVASGLLSIGPRLLVNLDDVPATNLLQPGNRATWRLLVADLSNRDRLDPYLKWLSAELKPGQRMENVRDLRPEIRQTLERADQFLGLSSLVAVVLAAVAIALAASRYLRRHLDTAAMLRCFGASRARTLALFVLQFAIVGLVASAVGLLVALAGQQLLVVLLGSIAAGDLPAPGVMPALAAFATGILLLLGFALPPLIALAGAPPLRVLRRDLPRPRPGGILAYALGASVIAALIGWQAQDAKTGAIVVAGIGGLLAAAALTAWILVVLLKRLPQRGVTWRFGLANLRRRPLASSLQIGALALGLMALLLLTVVRGDLMRNWRASLPPDAPNHFLVNVLPDQVDGVRAALKAVTGADTTLFPMVRGRLVAVNGTPLDTTTYSDTRARRLAEREFNLSWASELAKTNRITAGAWFGAATGPDAGISMEEGIANQLKLKLGDALTWDLAGATVTAKITSLRKVEWDSFRPNFFTLFAPGVLESMSITYLGAARIPEGPQSARVAVLVRAAVPERARDRRRRDHPSGADDHGPGRARGRVRVPVHAARRAARAAGGHRGDAGRAPLRRRDPAHARRVAGAAARRAGRRIPGAGRACRAARGRGRDGHWLRAFRSRLPDPVRVESAGVDLRSRRWLGGGDARRLARNARHGAASAARSDSPTRVTTAHGGTTVASESVKAIAIMIPPQRKDDSAFVP